jgi:intein/homing endonuclease
MAWWDFYRLWTYQFEKGPIERQSDTQVTGAGVIVPDAMPDLRGDSYGATQSQIRLYDSNDFIDLSTVTNRQSRYKEYERLRSVAEMEMAMTVISDEACVSGDTKISTLFDGQKTIRWLTERWEKDQSPFLVYCWDFDKEDYSLGWAYDPRFVKKSETLKILLDDGSSFVVTPDHRILTKGQEWVHAEDLEVGSELMPFYRIGSNKSINKLKTRQFPRVFTFDGWKHERQFIDEWREGRNKKYKEVSEANRLIAAGASCRDVESMMKRPWKSIDSWIKKEGFCTKELKWLGKRKDHRKVIGILPHKEIDVFDMSVKNHENFCTDSVVMHNCQRNEHGNVFSIRVEDQQVKKELEFLCFNRKMLNLNRKAWQIVKKLCIFGDGFYELITDPKNPKDGILKIQELPADSMYKIVTTKGRVVEFQQSKEGPDYQALTRSEVARASEQELMQSTAIRFAPNQVVHMYIGDDRRTFYPYGQSLMEPARGPAHQLRLMEDAMMVYRLCLVGDTRIRTKEGYKYIKDLVVGDDVFSYGPEKEQIASSVVNFANNGVKDVYRVRSKRIEITGTATHPILVNRDGVIQYVDIQNLVPGSDKMINVRREGGASTPIPRTAGEKWAKLGPAQRAAFRNSIYENKSELMRSCGFRKDRVKQFLYSEGKALPYDVSLKICEVFSLDPDQLIITNKGQINAERMRLPEFVDEEFARLFGFLIGDGCIRKNQYQLCFAAGTDEHQNSYYAEILERYFGRVKFCRDKRSNKKNMGTFVVSSQEACRILMKMGYVPGARNKRIPSWVFSSPAEIRRAFVEGISDADGGERRTRAGTWLSTIELCNKRLVEDIKEVWSSIGLGSGRITTRKRRGGHEIVPGRRIKPSVSYIVTISDKEVSEYENVLSVEHVGQEEVYDITVDNEIHNFIANGTPVHNTRAPERRVFYIDVGQLPPFKAEAFVERMKDQFRKKKVPAGRGTGANAVEERWHAPAADEDYWIPIRPSANTRIETLPGAQNLGEIDDALYFRNKLFTALNFPKNYLSNEDVGATRITLSAQDARFARMVERIQASVEDTVLEICERHLEMRGFPSESYEDLKVDMTAPSSWKELSDAEIMNNRINIATTLKSSMLMSDFDLLTKFMKMPEEEAKKVISRNKIQKLEDLKIQIIGQNPQLLGVGTPAAQGGEQEMGTEAGGPSANLNLEPPAGEGQPEQPEQGEQPEQPEQEGEEATATPIPDPSEDDIKKYDLGLEDYSRVVDDEDIDWSEEG